MISKILTKLSIKILLVLFLGIKKNQFQKLKNYNKKLENIGPGHYDFKDFNKTT